MNLTQLYLDTFIPEYPKIINGNFASVSRYVDVFYDGSLGILTKPLTTTGRVKGAKGEFVTVVVDNLIVKNQFTNLFDNNTTADYNFYKLYIDTAVAPRDPCTAITWWPHEYDNINYVDVNKPYYKIQNSLDPYVFVNSNLSQVIGIFLDPSLVSSENQFQVILNPVTGARFTADASAAGDPSIGTGFYVELIAVAYDPSYGTTWAQYKHGLPVVGTGEGGGGGGIGGSGTAGFIPVFNSGTTITNSPLEITGGTTLNTLEINVDGIITLTNKKITGVATPTNPTDAVNLAYIDPFTTNSSVNTALAQFMRSGSAGTSLIWTAGILDVSVNLTGITESQMRAYVDPSLALKANNASLGLYATNSSINTAGFAKNASLGLYATNASINTAGFASNASVNLALGVYATNVSINTAGFAKQIYVDGSLTARDSSITWLYNYSLTTAALNPYATNASIGSASFLKIADISSFATNVSIGLAGFATNASINNTLVEFIRSTSTGLTLYWNGGILDVSAVPSAGPTFEYVDGSLFTRDSSISWLINNMLVPADLTSFLTDYATIAFANSIFATNTSVNDALYNYYTSAQVDSLFINQAYVDGSLALQQLQINSLDNRVTILESSIGVTFDYIDSSLFTRDSSIILLFNRLFTTDTSLDILTSRYNITEVSLGLSLGDYVTNTSINAAGFAKNSSVNFLYNWQLTQDASILLIIGANATQQSQITFLQNKNATQDGSIIRMDSSIDWLMQQTSGEITTEYFHEYVDNSLGERDNRIDDLYLLNFIRSSSTGNGLYWNASNNKLDVSIGISQVYVDGSLNQRDIQINQLNASIGRIDASLNDVIDISALLGSYATNSSVGLALSPFTTNASAGTALSKFILSVSIGTGLFWDGGMLDISIDQLSGSIGYISVYNPLLTSSNLQFLNGALVNMSAANFIISASTGTASHNNGFDIQLISGNPYNISGAWAGQLYLRGGNARAGDVSSGMGHIYLIPGTDRTGSAIGTVFLGESTTPGTSRTIQSNGAGNIDLILNPAGSGAVSISNYSNTGGVRIHGVQISNTTNKINLTRSNSFVTHMVLDGGTAGGSNTWVAGHAVIKGGYGTNTAGYLNGGNVYIYPGLEASVGIRGNLYFGTEAGVPMLTEVSTNKILFYNDASGGRITYGNVPAGVTALAALTDVSLSVSIGDKSFLQYDTSIGKWKDVSSLDANVYFQEKATFETKTSTGDGSVGNMAFDASYFYICTGANQWGRVLLDTGVF